MGYTTTTNLSLRKPAATNFRDIDLDDLNSHMTVNMGILEDKLTGTTSVNTNPSIINTGGYRFTFLYACSAGSISTITGMVSGMPFTLLNGSSGASLALLDASPFFLAGNFIPNDIGENITLVWNGSSYFELGRSTA